MEYENQEDEIENWEEENYKPKIRKMKFDNQESEIENHKNVIVIKLYVIDNQYFVTAQEGADALNMSYPTFTRKYKKQDVKVTPVVVR